jgi:N-acetylneuraminic acid mutarotase
MIASNVPVGASPATQALNTWLCSTDETGNNACNGGLTLPPMPTARVRLTAATGKDGRIYTFGGLVIATGTSVDTVEVYDPTMNTWACSIGDASPGCQSLTIQPMPSPRDGLGSALGFDADGSLYTIGGTTIITGTTTVLNAVEVYDPVTNTWTCSHGDVNCATTSWPETLTPMPTQRTTLAVATGTDHLIYAIGGSSGPTGVDVYLQTVEAYDPTADSWTTIANMPTARALLGAALAPDGQIYAVGGWNGNLNGGTIYDYIEAYNTTSHNWTCSTDDTGSCAAKTLPPVPTARQGLAVATAQNGLMYTIDGSTLQSGVVTPLNSVEAFSTKTGTWTSTPSAPTARARIAASVGTDGRIYVLGGLGPLNSGQGVEVYAPPSTVFLPTVFNSH